MNRHELKDLFKIRDILFMHRHEVKELRCGDFARIATLTFEKGMVISSYEHTILEMWTIAAWKQIQSVTIFVTSFNFPLIS